MDIDHRDVDPLNSPLILHATSRDLCDVQRVSIRAAIDDLIKRLDGGITAPDANNAAKVRDALRGMAHRIDNALRRDLNIWCKTARMLDLHDINSAAQLTAMTEQDLLALRGVGPGTVADIKNALAERGQRLKENPNGQ
jgi:DNA-directed RNA polymerase alpha subunit